MGGIINIILGIVFIIGGLSGKLVLIGTNNGPALAVVGLILVVVGAVRMTRQPQWAGVVTAHGAAKSFSLP